MTEIHVKVEPGSDEFGVENSSIPRIELVSKPENGRANQELKEKIEQLTGERPGILSGHQSRRKKIVIDISEEEFRRKIGEYNG